jgi:hypothetical protein
MKPKLNKIFQQYKSAISFNILLLLLITSSVNGQFRVETFGGSLGYRNAVRYNSTGELYTVLQDASNGNKITVQKQNGASWEIVGTAGFSTYMVYEPTIALDQTNGDLYVAYIESVSGIYKLSCNKYNGTSWIEVGTPEFLITGAAGKPGMTIDNYGNPVIITPYYNGFYVYQYDGTTWNNLTASATGSIPATTPIDVLSQYGGNGSESKNNYFPFVNTNGDIYVAVSSPLIASDGVNVFKYSAGVWTSVGSNLPGGSNDAFQRVVKAPDGTIFVAYSQTSNFNSICKIYVYKLNGSSWQDITNGGTQIFNSNYNNFNSFSFDIAFDSNSIPYVVYQNTGVDWRAYIKKYNPSTNNWDIARSGQVGGFYMDSGMRLFIDNGGLPYYVGTSSNSEPRVYIVENKPVFNTTSFLPAIGPIGTTVNIYGGNFTGTTAVKFNGTTASFTINSNTSITAIVPSNTTTGTISVTNAAGTSTTNSIFSLPPTNGSIAFSGTNQSISTTVAAPGNTSTTFEMWFRQSNNNPSSQGILQTRTNSFDSDGFDVSIANGSLTISTHGTWLYIGAGTVNTNTWYHLALVRNGSSAWTIYLNGTSVGTFNFSNTTGSELVLGRKEVNSIFFNGHISNFRYVKGAAVYTANFTPPTAALTAIAGTQLLLNTYTGNAFLNDNSGNNSTITNSNSVISSTYEPFSPTPHPAAITSFTPTSGLVSASINLTGNYFLGTTDVRFNGTSTTFTINNDTSITALVPVNATTGTISVTNAAGTTTSTTNFTILIDNGDYITPTITYPIALNNSNSATLKLSENTTGVTTFTANEAVTWSITGGSEAVLFNINPNSGLLTFINPPLFANPQDSVPFNSYIVEITATDGNRNVSSQILTIYISPFCGNWGN